MASTSDPESPATSARGLRYMTNFTCLGPACEENCCSAGWEIPIDERSHQRLHETMSAPADRALLTRALAPALASMRSPQRFATIELTDEGACPFYDQERMCSLQRRFGASLLPDACATYPRIVSRVGTRLELAGALGCPEVARHALLTADATDLAPVGLDSFDGFAQSQRLRGDAGPAARLDLVRDAMYQLLSTPDRPLDARLFAVAHFGYQLDGLVAERPPPAELAAAIAPAVTPESLAALDQLFDTAPDDGCFGLGCVLELLSTLPGAASLRLPGLIREVRGSFSGSTSEEVWPQFVRRRDALSADRRAQANALVERYAKHLVITEWYAFSPRLRMYVMMLVLRVTTLRFLLLGHPEAATFDASSFDRFRVEILYSFARAIERNPKALSSQLELVDRVLPTFAHAVPLLRLAGRVA